MRPILRTGTSQMGCVSYETIVQDRKYRWEKMGVVLGNDDVTNAVILRYFDHRIQYLIIRYFSVFSRLCRF